MSQQRLAISVRNEALQTLKDRHEDEYIEILNDLCAKRGVTPALFHPDGLYGTLLDYLKVILLHDRERQISPTHIAKQIDLDYRQVSRLFKEQHERGDIELTRDGTNTYARLLK